MDEQMTNRPDYRLAMGFMTGLAIGAALATWLGPNPPSVRAKMTRVAGAAGAAGPEGSRHP